MNSSSIALIIFVLSLGQASYAETCIMLVRHGETNMNREKRIQGTSDSPLNENGQSQAKHFADSFGFTPDAIYSSDLQRALMTAQPLAEKYALAVHTDGDFRELEFGILEGEQFEGELSVHHRTTHSLISDRQTKWNTPVAPKAETNNEFLKRFNRGLIEIAKQYPGKRVVIFTHGKAISVVINSLSDKEDAVRLGNCESVSLVINLAVDGVLTIQV